MFLSSALESVVFRHFAAVVGGLLGCAGTLLLLLRAVGRSPLTSVIRTYRSWLWMAPLPFIALLGGREVTIAAIGLLSVCAFREFALATSLAQDRWMTALVSCAIVLQMGVALVTDPRLLTPGWYGLFMALPAYVIGLIVMVPILRNRTQGQLLSISLAVFGYVYFGWMFGHLAFLANSDRAIGYILYLVFAIAVADISAFTSGKLIGRAKLRDQVSPQKTWGGAMGALVVGMSMPWLMRFALPEFTSLQLVLTGLIVGVGGQVGDLVISYIKRDLGIKDMGQCIPGHGGLLDRIDSLVFTAPLFFHLIRWFGGM